MNFTNLENHDLDINDVIKLAQDKSNEVLEMMQENNYSFQEVINFFKENLPGFSLKEQRTFQKVSTIEISEYQVKKTLKVQSNAEGKQKLQKIRSQLRKAEEVTTYGATAAGIAAAGFFALA
jgi:uncharacterized membrane-anchored protein